MNRAEMRPCSAVPGRWLRSRRGPGPSPPAPLAGNVRREVYAAGCGDAAVLANLDPEQLAAIAPPIEEVLP